MRSDADAAGLRTMRVEEFAAPGSNRGAGFALQIPDGRYAFSISGTHTRAPEGVLYMGGIGGHAETYETLLECAKREAWEEIRACVNVISAAKTWLIKARTVEEVTVPDLPRPLILLDRPLPGETGDYRKVIYRGELACGCEDIHPDLKEVRGLIALHLHQLLWMHKRPMSVGMLRGEGALFVPELRHLDPEIPIEAHGVAGAIGAILAHCIKERQNGSEAA